MDDASDRPRGERFLRSDRILKRRDYLRVQQTGKRVHTPHFVIIVLPAPSQRIGITVTKKVAGAVGRNRIRRRVREVFRLERDAFPDACEMVVIARQGAAGLDYGDIRDELTSARSAMTRAVRSRAARNGGAQ